MIDADILTRCASRQNVLALMESLGYPMNPVEIVTAEWRRAGIDVPWNGATLIELASRTADLDLYLITGDEAGDAAFAERFLRSLKTYNAVVKPGVVAWTGDRLIVQDLSPRRSLRRLEVDLTHPTIHAIDRINLLAAGADPIRVFDRALDRELLTRQFFERFRVAVEETASALRLALLDERHEAIDSQALLLLSRLLFLYFIQQKGWLNGERRFVIDRVESVVRSGRNAHATVLRPLFFGCLNTAVADRDKIALRLGEIPYLNGGLFEPSSFEVKHPEISLPNELIVRILEEVFEKFDFSIDENDLSGVHVDPEMLGRVFESLMAAPERLASGTFYTPREIVDALAGRAIVEWLSDGDEATRDLLEAVLRGESPRTPSNADELLARLGRITVLDPACGSGAFLLAALTILERIGRFLDPDAPSTLRRSIIERSLFGVDLKPEAVRLCELRLWLATVSHASADAAAVEPLPNLDRNILQGNSLLSPTDFLGTSRADVYQQWVYALRTQADLIGRYRNARPAERPSLARMIRATDRQMAMELVTRAIELDQQELQRLSLPERDLFGHVRNASLSRCRELHSRIVGNQQQIDAIETGQLDFFSFDVHFAHVMAAGGFDVVVGNPPWVRNQRIDPAARRMYRERYRLFRGEGAGKQAAFHQPDLSIAFFERAVSLAASDGIVSLLLPSKILNAGYAAALRRHTERTLSIVAIDDWSEDSRRHFDADTFPLGLTVSRASRRSTIRVGASRSFELRTEELTVCGSEWTLLPDEVRPFFERIQRTFAPLSNVLGRMPLMGVKTGRNHAFFLTVKRLCADKVETVEGIAIPLEFVARCVRGRDLHRWCIDEPGWMLWPPPGGWKTAPRWLERLAAERGLEPSSFVLSYVRPEHIGIKVAWKDLSRGIQAASLPDRWPDRSEVRLVPNQTVYSIDAATEEEAFVLAALLNSTIANALALAGAERAKDSHFRYFGRTMSRLPWPQIFANDDAWIRLARAARQARAGDRDVIPQVDRIVGGLYGATEEEQAALRCFVDRRLGFTRDAS